jgi:hypothetical protein
VTSRQPTTRMTRIVRSGGGVGSARLTTSGMNGSAHLNFTAPIVTDPRYPKSAVSSTTYDPREIHTYPSSLASSSLNIVDLSTSVA